MPRFVHACKSGATPRLREASLSVREDAGAGEPLRDVVTADSTLEAQCDPAKKSELAYRWTLAEAATSLLVSADALRRLTRGELDRAVALMRDADCSAC